MTRKLLAFLALVVIVFSSLSWFDVLVHQPVSAAMAVAQMSDDPSAATNIGAYDSLQRMLPAVALGGIVVSGFFVFRSDIALGVVKVKELVSEKH